MPRAFNQSKSSAVIHVSRCRLRRSDALALPSASQSVYSSSAWVPAYTVGVIHFSRASQPPRFTPRHLPTGLSVTPAEALDCPIRIPIAALAIIALFMKSRRLIGLPSTLGEKESVQRHNRKPAASVPRSRKRDSTAARGERFAGHEARFLAQAESE